MLYLNIRVSLPSAGHGFDFFATDLMAHLSFRFNKPFGLQRLQTCSPKARPACRNAENMNCHTWRSWPCGYRTRTFLRVPFTPWCLGAEWIAVTHAGTTRVTRKIQVQRCSVFLGFVAFWDSSRDWFLTPTFPHWFFVTRRCDKHKTFVWPTKANWRLVVEFLLGMRWNDVKHGNRWKLQKLRYIITCRWQVLTMTFGNGHLKHISGAGCMLGMHRGHMGGSGRDT